MICCWCWAGFYVQLSQTGRTWGTGAALQIPALQVLLNQPHFVSPSLPRAQLYLWDVSDTNPARWSCFHPLGLSKAPGWQTEPQSSRLVPAKPLPCSWGETSSLHSPCVALTTLWRESYPGHPHRSLWPPQPLAVSELLKNQALPLRRWTNSSLRSCLP